MPSESTLFPLTELASLQSNAEKDVAMQQQKQQHAQVLAVPHRPPSLPAHHRMSVQELQQQRERLEQVEMQQERAAQIEQAKAAAEAKLRAQYREDDRKKQST